MIDHKIINDCEKQLKDKFEYFEEIALFNQEKVLNAFKKNKIALRHFNGTSGYGYGDEGRDTLNVLISDIFGTEKAVCSPFIVSGTHALSLCLYAILRPNDTALCITGEPYDTLSEVIKGKEDSLDAFNIKFYSIPLKNNKVDVNASLLAIKKYNPKMIYIQRSRGYEWRDALSVNEIKEIISDIKSSGYNGIFMVDNCYGEFMDKYEPTDVGANIMAGSMIKNIGGGIAPTGGYIAGDSELIGKVLSRLTAPSIAGEVGSYLFGYQQFYQGIFLAPHVVLQAVKGSLLFGAVLEKLGYETSPSLDSMPNDIIRAIKFNDSEKLIKFVQTIQANSPIDSNVLALPWDMPGYKEQVIMAAGCFVQGSSIELSADAPIKPPFIGYLQGGLTYEHCKIALKNMDL